MMEYKYILDKGSAKFTCANCGKKKFVRYVNIETQEYLPMIYGRCDRESKCSYHLNPYEDGYSENNYVEPYSSGSLGKNRNNGYLDEKRPINGVIPYDILKRLLSDYEENVFIQNLLTNISYPFLVEDIEEVISLYYLGTIRSGYRASAVTLPFIDVENNIRAIQVKQFNDDNHTIGTDFLHSMLKKHYVQESKSLPNWLQAYLMADKKVSCLFGEHLLTRYPAYTIALVEAPKTAVIGSLYFGLPDNPSDLLWLAVYNKSSYSYEKVEVLKGRNVIVFPDLSSDGATYNEWLNKSREFEMRLPNTKFVVSDLLEKFASNDERENGLDLADYLIKQDWRVFRNDKSQSHDKCDMEIAALEKFERRIRNVPAA
ncbi:DUF6371 domain-containing protein [Lentimicrobium sp. S6]|uniref:DUF6371 domain-containing protein n=1 Tax=Lentimicrobium sp. S6 TaxID=2735872 RepID=UPI001C12F58E|nr:DUF6371 domain-containing protein [Lentimicrobium sp. S6]